MKTFGNADQQHPQGIIDYMDFDTDFIKSIKKYTNITLNESIFSILLGNYKNIAINWKLNIPKEWEISVGP